MIGLPFSAITSACRSGSRRISSGRMIAMSSPEKVRPAMAPVCQLRPGDPGLADQVGDLLVERAILGATKHHLRQYRRIHNVPMVELRDFIESLRQRLGVPYQLAHERPFVSGRRLVREAQEEAGIDGEFALVAEASGQYILSAAAQEFFERVTWEHDTAVRWRPDATRESPVVIDPDVRFGAPSVGGISTEILWEQSEGGDDDQDLANIFGLTLAQVRWALACEATQAA